MKPIVIVLAFACLCSISPSIAMAQERSAKKQGFDLTANSGKTILLFRPAVRLGAQSTGGMFEPNADWTEQAKTNLASALGKFQGKLGNKVIVAPDAYGDDARSLQEHMALFGAISQSVIGYQFFVGNRLPTKKRENKLAVFDWSEPRRVCRRLSGLSHAAIADVLFMA